MTPQNWNNDFMGHRSTFDREVQSAAKHYNDLLFSYEEFRATAVLECRRIHIDPTSLVHFQIILHPDGMASADEALLATITYRPHPTQIADATIKREHHFKL